eukprot:911990_1
MGNNSSRSKEIPANSKAVVIVDILVLGFIRQNMTFHALMDMESIPKHIPELIIKYYQFTIRYMVTSLWKRSESAEGNPTHKPQTRIQIEAKHQPVEIVPLEGITMSSDWHRDLQVKQRNWVPDPGNRAILLQTKENVEILRSTFPNVSIFSDFTNNSNVFGENVMMKRFDSDAIESTCSIFCIGDVLEIQRNGYVVGELSIASPRWPCYKIDKRCDVKDRQNHSVQKHCVDTSLGGMFCSVLMKGTIRCGDVIRIKDRVHHDLTLDYVAGLCYGGEKNKRTCLINEFRGNQQQFQQLIECKELATFEWKERLLRWQKKQQKKLDQNTTDTHSD